METSENTSNIIILKDKILRIIKMKNLENIKNMADKIAELQREIDVIVENIELIRNEINIK